MPLRAAGPLPLSMKGRRRFSVDNIYTRTSNDEDPPILLARRQTSDQEPPSKQPPIGLAPQSLPIDTALNKALQQVNAQRRHTVDLIPFMAREGKGSSPESRLTQQRGSISSDRSSSTIGSARRVSVEAQALWDLQLHGKKRSSLFSDTGAITPNTMTSETFTLNEAFEFGSPYPFTEDEKSACDEEPSFLPSANHLATTRAQQDLFEALSFSLNLLDEPSEGFDLPENVLQELQAAAL